MYSLQIHCSGFVILLFLNLHSIFQCKVPHQPEVRQWPMCKQSYFWFPWNLSLSNTRKHYTIYHQEEQIYHCHVASERIKNYSSIELHSNSPFQGSTCGTLFSILNTRRILLSEVVSRKHSLHFWKMFPVILSIHSAQTFISHFKRQNMRLQQMLTRQ